MKLCVDKIYGEFCERVDKILCGGTCWELKNACGDLVGVQMYWFTLGWALSGRTLELRLKLRLTLRKPFYGNVDYESLIWR